MPVLHDTFGIVRVYIILRWYIYIAAGATSPVCCTVFEFLGVNGMCTWSCAYLYARRPVASSE